MSGALRKGEIHRNPTVVMLLLWRFVIRERWTIGARSAPPMRSTLRGISVSITSDRHTLPDIGYFRECSEAELKELRHLKPVGATGKKVAEIGRTSCVIW
jgi:hypothetical protein